MTIPSEILELWQQHTSATFPKGYGERQIKGIDLPLLEAEIASCLRMYVHNRGELDSRRIKSLRTALIDLNTIVLLLNSEELSYFDRLSHLANLVIREVEK